jgi:hypothetical protein
MHLFIPVVIGFVLGGILSIAYVYLIKGNERRIAIVTFGIALGGAVGGAVAWWLTS